MDRRKLIPIVLVLALAIAGAWYFGAFGKGSDGELQLYGNVDVRQVDLSFRSGGQIAEMAVDEGDRVKQGDILARLDLDPLNNRLAETDAQIGVAEANLAKLRNGSRPQEIAQAQARYSAAQAELTRARAEYDRRRPLVESGAISRSLWDQTTAQLRAAQAQAAEAQQALSLVRQGPRAEDIAAARAQLGSAQAMRNSIRTDIEDTALVAPESGVVMTRAVEPGAVVQPTQTVLSLSIDRPLRVRGWIGEPDMWRISPGMAVEVSTDGNPRTYKGKIASISPRAEFTPRTVQTESLRADLVYSIQVIVSDPDDALRQGQPVTIRVPGARTAKDK
ncbi:MAG: HlyD family efflux transporter periplasmic adaptor subunit [Sphingomonadales bacterium]|nr:HlyD family efflux transporter periplasmic adaptor subunit [Sphingomonadales bacterium]MBD3774642.1 HlyD family efflux transporter periplasmic adaptor subunit [Paracoccaceae bacterium]